MLVAAGADKLLKDNFGHDALVYASASNDLAIVEMLEEMAPGSAAI